MERKEGVEPDGEILEIFLDGVADSEKGVTVFLQIVNKSLLDIGVGTESGHVRLVDRCSYL